MSRRAMPRPASWRRRRRGSPTWRPAAATPRSPRREADLADLIATTRSHRQGPRAQRGTAAYRRRQPADGGSAARRPGLRHRARQGGQRETRTNAVTDRAAIRDRRAARHGGAGTGRAGTGGVAGGPASCRRAGRRTGVRYLCAARRDHQRRGPVVSLLPPQNILVRFFVPETKLATLHRGDRLAIGCDACAPGPDRHHHIHRATAGIHAAGDLQRDQPREAGLSDRGASAADQAAQLKPGQPVDVRR